MNDPEDDIAVSEEDPVAEDPATLDPQPVYTEDGQRITQGGVGEPEYHRGAAPPPDPVKVEKDPEV